ncbi:hypothetical protein LOC67_07385 [Stieleria sp. JC731]|uniref:hypothetical protein n=1 Tax=Pirellulaceae TaxID=2691357 RepID=UPI001E509FBF|nr:hypothetical protein [Stieleria sp. JC731]MCC9600379.1 hypothetical protein [Stieleria sp. JC731]
MPVFVECRFCHKKVLRWLYSRHTKSHTQLLPDGQMTDHISVAESDRFQGSLGGVPSLYIHRVCGVETRMPEQIIRSYLANPLLYSSCTFCIGCGDYVPMSECEWSETVESLIRYRRNLMKKSLGTRPMLTITPQAADAVLNQIRRQQNSHDSALRLKLVELDDGSPSIRPAIVTNDYDPETDWRGDYFGLTLLVNFDEAANYAYGATVSLRKGKLEVQLAQ